MSKDKTILFLSCLDFKEKSIQVIRKTPEAYLKSGWKVFYVVARDNSKYGNYFYEKEIFIDGIKLHRIYAPLTKIVDIIPLKKIRTIINKIRFWIAIIKIAKIANDIIKNNKIDIIYGYEYHGVLAIKLLKMLGKLDKNTKVISRFQGTYYYYYLKNKNFFKLLANFDQKIALKFPVDLLIMTNDGTEGDWVLKKIKSPNMKNFKFWVNGVDEQKLPKSEIEKLKDDLNLRDKIVLTTICRLERWKRVERGIYIIEKLVNKYKVKNLLYFIVGDGTEKDNLQDLVKKLNLENCIIFVGFVKNEEVKKYLNIADIFISTYDVSNVGNPLLEAIRANKIIFTLNNGSTGEWIKHKVNGFIYDLNENTIDNMAKDICELINNEDLQKKIIENIKITEKEKLWTWEERFNAELNEVERLLQKNENKV
jgi:glycosyltransferase involved in cell wall biosynthesis